MNGSREQRTNCVFRSTCVFLEIPGQLLRVDYLGLQLRRPGLANANPRHLHRRNQPTNRPIRYQQPTHRPTSYQQQSNRPIRCYRQTDRSSSHSPTTTTTKTTRSGVYFGVMTKVPLYQELVSTERRGRQESKHGADMKYITSKQARK